MAPVRGKSSRRLRSLCGPRRLEAAGARRTPWRMSPDSCGLADRSVAGSMRLIAPAHDADHREVSLTMVKIAFVGVSRCTSSSRTAVRCPRRSRWRCGARKSTRPGDELEHIESVRDYLTEPVAEARKTINHAGIDQVISPPGTSSQLNWLSAALKASGLTGAAPPNGFCSW
jgi:hypothetical protein